MTNKIKILISYVLSNLITSSIVNKKGVTFLTTCIKELWKLVLSFPTPPHHLKVPFEQKVQNHLLSKHLTCRYTLKVSSRIEDPSLYACCVGVRYGEEVESK